jgi:hypothetical protein
MTIKPSAPFRARAFAPRFANDFKRSDAAHHQS